MARAVRFVFATVAAVMVGAGIGIYLALPSVDATLADQVVSDADTEAPDPDDQEDAARDSEDDAGDEDNVQSEDTNELHTVTVVADGDESEVETDVETVAEALDDADIELSYADLIEPELDEPIGDDDIITVRRVEIITETEEVPIEHSEERQETDDLVDGETEVGTEGRDGIRRETYQVTLIDGEEESRELVNDEVAREPVDELVMVGTAPGPVEEAQQLLADLGYPVGPADGVEGTQTQRALCAWRQLEGHDASRAGLQDGELEALRETSGLPAADAGGRSVTVDRTCQVLYYADGGQWQHVYAASTGADGLPNPDSYTIQWKRPGWHTSTLYPAPEPNMYNSMYIRGAIAIHGSHSVPTHPASAGCVRVTPDVADFLFERLDDGDPVEVIGTY